MENNLTIIKQPTRINSAGETEASSAEEQLARDNQPKATNCRWGGSFSSAIPFYDSQRQFRALLCLKKPPCRKQGYLLTVKVICPIHAEPVQNQEPNDLMTDAVEGKEKFPRTYPVGIRHRTVRRNRYFHRNRLRGMIRLHVSIDVTGLQFNIQGFQINL